MTHPSTIETIEVLRRQQLYEAAQSLTCLGAMLMTGAFIAPVSTIRETASAARTHMIEALRLVKALEGEGDSHG